MEKITQRDIDAGQAVYNRFTLSFYDIVVLGLSNRFIWKCPTPGLLEFYNRHVSGNHLDVGVGTGFFLDRCVFPADQPRVVLLDLNPDSLAAAARRIRRYVPTVYRRNVLEPLQEIEAHFDSVGVNYLLHCLPGTIESKAVVFDNLKPLMNPGAVVFGSTLLQEGVQRSAPARALMRFYNKKGIFTNTQDTVHGLKSILQSQFSESSVQVRGCAALFQARI